MPTDMTPRQALSRLLQSEEFQRLEAELARVSAFHVLGIERRELSHAALLGWLLNPRAHHGLGTLPLRSFLLMACGLGGETSSGPDAVEIDGLDLHGAQIGLEVPARSDAGRTRRLDLVVTVPHQDSSRAILIVEYKVDAGESEDQTVDYACWAAGETARHRWPTEPLLVYLCPGQGQPTSERFVVVDYDAYVPWLGQLLERRPSRTAAFLIKEFRACLGQRDDVQDDHQDALREAVLASERDAIEVLRRSAPKELRTVALRHREAMNALGLFRSRRSKGYSAFVDAFRQALQATLDEDQWRVGGGEGSLVAVYLPSVSVLHEVTGRTGAPTSALRVHLFMERPRNEQARAVLEVIGNHPQLDVAESKRLREQLASMLRDRFEPRFDQQTRGQIVGAFVFRIPGVRRVEQDTRARADAQVDQLRAKAEAVRDLGQALLAWTPEYRTVLEVVSSATGRP